MKKLVIVFGIILFSFNSYSQNCSSRAGEIVKIEGFIMKGDSSLLKDSINVITLADKEISISNFRRGKTYYSEGDKKILKLNVTRIEEKESGTFGKGKYYFCLPKNRDPKYGVKWAVIIKSGESITLWGVWEMG
jgi:hypothetical protein